MAEDCFKLAVVRDQGLGLLNHMVTILKNMEHYARI